jgi:hypothetical protein
MAIWDVQNCQQFQVIDVDFNLPAGARYEVKGNYKDDGVIIIEEFTNCNSDFGPISTGWFDKSRANVFAFISTSTYTTVLINNSQEFHQHYDKIKHKYELIKNKPTYKSDGAIWQSAYRRIPIDDIADFCRIYMRHLPVIDLPF